MTYRQHFLAWLQENGLSPTQAESVITFAQSHAILDSFAPRRWNDSKDDYPPAMLAVMTVSMKAIALEWIDANVPQHWARPMFV